MGQLNIKDDTLIEKVRLLAERRSTTQTEVLRQAVDEALARDEEMKAMRREAKAAAIRAIVERSSKMFPPDWDGDHSYLYDENGLPK